MKNSFLKHMELFGQFTSTHLGRLVKQSVLLFVLFSISISGLYAQECKVVITAKNNIESVNSEGRVYFMKLQNLGNKDLNINLTTENSNTGINPDKSQGITNVNLNAEIFTENKELITGGILLPAYSTYNFLVHVTVPPNTPIQRWNCTEVKAISEQCPEIPASFFLNTYIPQWEK